MAEVLGAASAIAGLISLSGTLLAQGYAFVSKVHQAPQHLREVLSEAAALDVVLNQLQGIVESRIEDESTKSLLTRLSEAGLINECNQALTIVNTSIRKCEQIEGQHTRNLGKRVLWPFKEKETKDTLLRLSRIRDNLSTALTADMAGTLNHIHQLSKESATGLSSLQNWTVNQDQNKERKMMRKWLQEGSINVEDNLNEGLRHKHPETKNWLFQSDFFKTWLAGQSSLLWIHGIPGSGKTVLASSVISTILSQERDKSEALVYFFCDHRVASKRTVHGFLTTGVLQMINQSPALQDQAISLFRACSEGDARPITLGESRGLFTSLMGKFAALTIVIDALDESNEVEGFVEELRQLLAFKRATVRILATGRQNYELERSLGMLSTYRIALEQYIEADIEIFVTDEVHSRINTRKLKVRSTELKRLIIHNLSRHADGMFIWASFQLDIICRPSNDKAIRQALQELPRGLEDTYLQLLEQIKKRNLESLDLAVRALTWIVASVNPMTLGQIVEAISIDPGDSSSDIEKMITDENDLLETIGSLVTLHWTQRDPYVTLAHFTLYEFFQSETLQKHASLSGFFVSDSAWLDCTAICAQYLSFSDFQSPCETELEFLQRKASYKLLTFAAGSWNRMLRSTGARGPNTRKLLPQIQWFITAKKVGRGNFVSWQQVFQSCVDCSDYPSDPLYYAVAFDMVTLYDILIEEGSNPQYLYEAEYTPLQVAVIARDRDRVNTIIQTNPDLEARGPGRQTALHIAASNGQAEIVKILLEAGANPHVRTESGSTPFYRAARSGSIPTLQLLYDVGSDVNAATWDAWTPIFEAMENLHVSAVDWLVNAGAKLDQRILVGMSVIDFARDMCNDEIVSIITRGLSTQQTC